MRSFKGRFTFDFRFETEFIMLGWKNDVKGEAACFRKKIMKVGCEKKRLENLKLSVQGFFSFVPTCSPGTDIFCQFIYSIILKKYRFNYI